MTDPKKKKKLTLKELSSELPARHDDHKVIRQTARDLIEHVKHLVTMNQPLPTAELSRYLTMVCLAGIHDSHGSEQRDWVRIATGVLRTENAARKLESDDEKAIETRVEQVEKIVRAAEEYQRFMDVEVEYEEFDEPGNGRPRPQEG